MTTVVLGLDGASFELIDRWIDEGNLPNIQEVCREGASSDMQSCLPPVTCPNWKCYATGKNPGKLGVFWWEKVLTGERKIVNTSSSLDFHGKDFWRFLDEKVAIANLPTSYPPQKTNGVHISGGPGSEQSGYTYPEGLEKDLESGYGYKVHPEKISLLSRNSPDSKCVEEIHDLIDLRFDVVEDLIESGDYGMIHLTVFYINVLHHFFWDHDVVKEAWMSIDSRIGNILRNDDVEHLFIMSDHGSNRIETEFRVNTWLEENGYLVTKKGKANLLHRFGITRERVRPVLGRLGLEWWARQLVPKRVQNLLPSSEGTVKKTGKEDVIDWEDSLAVASGQGPVYILENDDERRKEIKNELLSKLDDLKDGDTHVIESAVSAGDLYSGRYVADGPDLVLDQASHVHIDGSIGSELVFAEPGKWIGENKDTGLFVAYGETIDDDANLEGMHILDIAPTVLHLMGYDVPVDMDGDVRKELFAPGTDPYERDVGVMDVEETDENEGPGVRSDEVEGRLEDLGYMG